MKIYHLVWSMKIGGVPTMISDIANEQVQNNDVTIVILNNMEASSVIESLDPRITIHRLNRPEGSKNPWYLLKLNILLLQESPDIIHCHATTMYKWLLFCRHFPCVVTIHNARPLKNYGGYKHIYAISNSVKHVIKQNSGQNSIVVYNGIHPEQVKKTNNRYVPLSTLKIVCVGRIFEYKGQQLLIEAADVLRSKEITDFSITLIGYGENKENLENRVKQLGLERHVFFTGAMSREDIFRSLCEYDLYIQPSITEGFGLTLAEAMSAKIPVLTSDLEGPMEVIDNGNHGFFFKSESIDSLVEKITSFYRGDIEIDVDSAYKFVCNNFDIKVTAQRYIDEYKRSMIG